MILPPIAKGDSITASWLNGLRDLILRSRVSVARDCGLTLTSGPYGTVIGNTPADQVLVGITTAAANPRSSKTVSFGTLQPYAISAVSYSGGLASTGTMIAAGPPVRFFNWTGSTISSNVWVKVIKMHGFWGFNGNDCSLVAP
jgi:hypothetical protein